MIKTKEKEIKKKRVKIANARDIKRGNGNVNPNMKARGGMGINIKGYTFREGKSQKPKIKGDRGYFISGFRLETGSLERSTGT